MTRDQFKIVKTMQELGISATKFANACKESVKKFNVAYGSYSYDNFLENWYKTGNFIYPND